MQIIEEHSMHDFSSNRFARNIIELSKSEVFSSVDWGGYSDFNQFLIATITKADCDKLSEIYQVFSTSPVESNLPTINHLKRQEGRKNVRKIFVKLIQYLSRAFDKPTTNAIKSISNIMMDNFGHLTVLDAINFIERIKKGEFKNVYQIISKYGITPEYLIMWIDEFLKKKFEREEEERLSFKNMGNVWIQSLPDSQRKAIEEFILNPTKKSKIEKDDYREKYDAVKARHLELQNKRGLKYQLEEAYAFQILKFQIENICLSDEELFAKSKIECKKIVDQLKLHLDSQEVKDKSINLPKAIKGTLLKIENEYKKVTCFFILKEGLERLEELNLLKNGVDVYWCINRFLPQWSNQYSAYYKRELDKGILPYDKDTYLKLRAVNWLKQKLELLNQPS